MTEHEYFVAAAIHTPELIEAMRKHLVEAEQAVQAVAGQAEGKQFIDRVRFTRLGFDVTDAYMQMVRAADSEVDYATAVAAGKRGLAAREELTAINGTFTTHKNIGKNGYAWWPGEVRQYEELLPFTAGPKVHLVAKLPLEWAFRRDPADAGAKEGWEKVTPDLAWWSGQGDARSVASRQANPGQWELVRSDLYLQAQGLVTPEFQSSTGHGWYYAEVELTAEQAAGDVHVRFPGLFNECWLYVNGEPVGHREFSGVWWLNDYGFEWDAARREAQAGEERRRAADPQPAPFWRHVPPAVPVPAGGTVSCRGTRPVLDAEQPDDDVVRVEPLVLTVALELGPGRRSGGGGVRRPPPTALHLSS